ncbi:hypothetical protein RS022_08950 [Candidatus Phytoplasma rubi]|uniref:Effector n=1 Tax=Candidatus Phytoplasma rubi TaxID=399025 RepID=A0ABY7BUT4_9MOLU|nr:hypothetical protein [Candidatus Phytoplasma rubi]WAN63682.1 hypothetical protein RS022_08950 [Candidatus Phytoplasma rubi]
MKIKNIFYFFIIPSFIVIFFIFVKQIEKKQTIKKAKQEAEKEQTIKKEEQNTKEIINHEYEQKNVFLTPKELLSKFDNYSKALAYLGLNQFIIGLQNNIEKYRNIWIGDKEIFIEQILNGTLKTASTPLICGIIDFLGEKLNKKIELYVNDKLNLDSINQSDSNTSPLILKLKNDKNQTHFFINYSDDTVGDGYCFFNAIIFLLDEVINNWKNIIFSDISSTKILTGKEILEISQKF